jgi:hypothetical protein
MGKQVKSRAQRREQFIQRAVGMYDALEDWYDAHPEATFGEIEQKAREQRRQLMGETLGILINQRSQAVELNAPVCPKCGGEMKRHEVRGKTVRGLEGRTRLERSYYVCPNECGETISPPGSKSAAAAGSVE